MLSRRGHSYRGGVSFSPTSVNRENNRSEMTIRDAYAQEPDVRGPDSAAAAFRAMSEMGGTRPPRRRLVTEIRADNSTIARVPRDTELEMSMRPRHQDNPVRRRMFDLPPLFSNASPPDGPVPEPPRVIVAMAEIESMPLSGRPSSPDTVIHAAPHPSPDSNAPGYQPPIPGVVRVLW